MQSRRARRRRSSKGQSTRAKMVDEEVGRLGLAKRGEDVFLKSKDGRDRDGG